MTQTKQVFASLYKSDKHVQLVEDFISSKELSEEDFWEKVSSVKTPLVEEIEGRPDKRLVTFVYRADEETKNVVLSQFCIIEYDVTKSSLERIPGTDAFVISYVFPSDSLFIYAFSLNDPCIDLSSYSMMDVNNDVFGRIISGFAKDPLNPDEWVISPIYAFGSKNLEFSVLQLEDFKKFVSKEVPKGEIHKLSLSSSILEEDRDFSVYLPSGYESSKEYPLIVFFDGQMYQKLVGAAEVMDQLISDSRMKESIALFVHHPKPVVVTRVRDFFRDEFYDAVFEEFIPLVKSKYSISKDPKDLTVVGGSFGGNASMILALKRPSEVGKIISQSGAFWLSNGKEASYLIQDYVKANTQGLEFYLSVGAFEIAQTFEYGPSFVQTSAHMRDVLRAKGNLVHYKEFSGGHDCDSWKLDLINAFEALLRD